MDPILTVFEAVTGHPLRAALQHPGSTGHPREHALVSAAIRSAARRGVLQAFLKEGAPLEDSRLGRHATDLGWWVLRASAHMSLQQFRHIAALVADGDCASILLHPSTRTRLQSHMQAR